MFKNYFRAILCLVLLVDFAFSHRDGFRFLQDNFENLQRAYRNAQNAQPSRQATVVKRGDVIHNNFGGVFGKSGIYSRTADDLITHGSPDAGLSGYNLGAIWRRENSDVIVVPRSEFNAFKKWEKENNGLDPNNVPGVTGISTNEMPGSSTLENSNMIPKITPNNNSLGNNESLGTASLDEKIPLGNDQNGSSNKEDSINSSKNAGISVGNQENIAFSNPAEENSVQNQAVANKKTENLEGLEVNTERTPTNTGNLISNPSFEANPSNDNIGMPGISNMNNVGVQENVSPDLAAQTNANIANQEEIDSKNTGLTNLNEQNSNIAASKTVSSEISADLKNENQINA